jgi:glutathione synthase
VQAFLPQALQAGDKRLLLIDGELRGAVQRIPQQGDHRGNVHVGGRAAACEISATDRRIAQHMADRLRQDGLFFVGVDVIAGRLIEVNVTSPTLIRELKALGGPDLAAEVIDSVERSGTSAPAGQATVAQS